MSGNLSDFAKCPTCGHHTNSKFCDMCGRDLRATCSHCGAVIYSPFCTACGTPFVAPAPAEAWKEEQEIPHTGADPEESAVDALATSQLVSDGERGRVAGVGSGLRRRKAIVLSSVLVASLLIAGGTTAAVIGEGNRHDTAMSSDLAADESTTSTAETTTSSTTTIEPTTTTEARPATPVPPPERPNPGGSSGAGGGAGSCGVNFRETAMSFITAHANVGLTTSNFGMNPDNDQRPTRVSIHARSAPEWPTDPHADFDVVCVGGSWEVENYAYVDQPISDSTMFKAVMSNLVGSSGATAIGWLESLGNRQVILGQVSTNCTVPGGAFVGDPTKKVTSQSIAPGSIVRSGFNISIMC